MLASHCCVGMLLIALLRLSAGDGTLKDRTGLLKKMLTNYERDLAPTDGTVVVSHFLSIQRVASLENGVLTLETWEETRWSDPRLKWSKKQYNVDQLEVPSKQIWLPDIMLVNNAEQYNGHVFGEVRAVVHSSGNVTFVPPKITRAFCQFDDSILFKKGEVTCILKYMPWTYTITSMIIQEDNRHEVLDNTNPKWRVVKVSTKRNKHNYHFGPNSVYEDLDYVVELKRLK